MVAVRIPLYLYFSPRSLEEEISSDSNRLVPDSPRSASAKLRFFKALFGHEFLLFFLFLDILFS